MSDKPKNILCVDDERDITEILKDALSTPTISVHTASNANEALASMEKLRPSLLISDINMPGMDGLRLLKEIRKLGYTFPVIMLTGFSDTEKMRTAWQLGAFDFLDKPINMELLSSTVDRALNEGVYAGGSPTKEQLAHTINLTLKLDALEMLKKKAAANKLPLNEFLEKEAKKAA